MQLFEVTLSLETFGAGNSGLLYRLPVDGDVYAQPLYVHPVQVGGALRDVLVVATTHNSVCAFDTSNLNGSPLWQVSLGPAMPMTNFSNESNFAEEIEITGTPAIDLA